MAYNYNTHQPRDDSAGEFTKTLYPSFRSAELVYNSDNDKVVQIKGTPAVGKVLTIKTIGAGGYSSPDTAEWDFVAGGSITAGTPAAQTGVSRLTFSGSTLAVAETGVAAGIYGTSTTTTELDISNTGQILSAETIAIAPITVNTTSPITGGAAVSVGGAITLSHANFGTAGTYGSSGSVPVITTNATGHITGVVNTPIVFPAGNPLDSIPTRNWKAGTGSNFPLANTDSIAIGDNSAATGNFSIAIGSSSLSNTNSVSIGYDSDGITNSVCIGSAAKALTNRGIAIGWDCSAEVVASAICIGSKSVSRGLLVGFDGQASHFTSTIIGNGNLITSNGVNNTIIGFSSGTAITSGGQGCTIVGALSNVQNAAISNSIIVGAASQSNASKANVVGNGLTNTQANTTLIGSSDAAHVLATTGFMRSLLQVSASAGVLPSEAAIVIGPVSAPSGVAVIDIVSTRFDKFEPTGTANVDLALNRVYLGGTADADHTFQVSATILFSSNTASANDRWSLIMNWNLEGTDFVVAGAATTTTGSGVIATLTATTVISLPAVLLTRSYVYCTLQRVSGTSTASATITNWRLAMSRIN